ncbi:MAG: energy-coupling factor transporter ATPase [Clostridia bacterium]|nr:energy-coupling factor transporter ATPase [Clostridia bacterium]
MEQKDIFIEVKGLCFTYNDDAGNNSPDASPALCNLDLKVARGEYVSILGHNGSGKSTLAKLLSMILIPTSGEIYIDGHLVSSPDISDDEIYEVRKKIGMVFQNPDNQLVATVVEEDVAFGPENLGIEREEMKKRITEALEMVGMTEYRRHAPHKLSGGQKQRVAIAGIIAMLPDCIIFDESTAMLDPLGRRDVIEIMERLNKERGITVLNITHYMDEAARANRVVVINDGEKVLDGTPKEVFSHVDELHSMGLEAPQGKELIHALNKCGIKVSDDALSEEECVEAIYSALIGD